MLEELFGDVIGYRYMIQFRIFDLNDVSGQKHHHHNFTRECPIPVAPVGV